MALPRAALLLISCAISVTSYEIRTLEPCFDNTIYLGSNDKSALNFSIGNYKIGPYPFYPEYKCTFKVEASSNEKILAVIQKMNLRVRDGQCMDYVEFTDPPKLTLGEIYGRLKNSKKQFCGNKNISIMSLPNDMVLHAYNLHTLPQNVYFVNGKELKVKVVISQAPLRPGETLDFQIIFTAARTGLECREKVEFDCGNTTCIWKGFYKDGFVNCPYVRCPDEEGCEGPTVKYSSGSGTTIIICAIVSMLSVLGMFLFCLFICRRCKVLCWASRSPATRDAGSRVHVSSSRPNETVQPSAPPLISLHDKDLPPSYDSLFPARSSEAGVSLVKDDGIDRCRRTRNFSSQKMQSVRMECGTMRYCRRKNISQNPGVNENQTEFTTLDEPINPRRNTRWPSNNRSRGRGRYSRMHRSHQPALRGNRNSGGTPRRGWGPRKSSNHNARAFQTFRNVNESRKPRCSRQRTRSETVITARDREWVRCRRNSEGSKWYYDLWQACCL